MKNLILFMLLAASSSVFAAFDAPSAFVNQALTNGKQILVIKDADTRTKAMCAFLSEKLAILSIANVWLGDFANLNRDRAAINEFRQLVPSIVMTKVLQGVGDRELGGSFQVEEKSKALPGQAFEVTVNITTNAGKKHTGFITVTKPADKFVVREIRYMDYKAVEQLGLDYQKRMNEFYQADPKNSLPISSMIEMIVTEDGYVECRNGIEN